MFYEVAQTAANVAVANLSKSAGISLLDSGQSLAETKAKTDVAFDLRP